MRIVPLSPGQPPTRVICVASGKGGVGKTSLATGLAFALAARGNRVCLLDADLGLANVDILLGVNPEKTLEDVLFGGVPMAGAIVPVAPGVDLVSGASGVPRLAELTRAERMRLAPSSRPWTATTTSWWTTRRASAPRWCRCACRRATSWWSPRRTPRP
jgi:flagellar biosynthesis protein FlhG